MVSGNVKTAAHKSVLQKKPERKLYKDWFDKAAQALHHTLPDSYPTAAGILVESLPEDASVASITDGWLQWPVGQFIADYGTDHFKESMHAMTELTRRFSSEFAVRPFVERYDITDTRSIVR